MNSDNRLFFLVTQAELWMYTKVTQHLTSAGIDFSIISMPNLELSHLTLQQSAQLNQKKLLDDGITSVLGVCEDGKILSPRKIASGSIVVVDQPNIELGLRWHPLFASRRFRLAYGAYGYKVSPLDKWNFNQFIHKKGWSIFVESEWHLHKFLEFNPTNGRQFHLTGSPKIQALRDLSKDDSSRDKRPVIVWAPHWSIGSENHLRYGTFDLVFLSMLRLAHEREDINFVLRPHQRLDKELRVRDKTLQDFLETWGKLPNCTVSLEAAYQGTLAGASCLITDSGSFIAEFSSLGKPLILLRRRDSSGYNEVGERIVSQQETLMLDPENFIQEKFELSLKSLLKSFSTKPYTVPSDLFPEIDSGGEIAHILMRGLTN